MLALRRIARPRVPPAERVAKWAFRALVWLVLVLLLLLGVRDVVRSAIGVRSTAGPAPASQFPRDAVAAYAGRFAIVYLSFDSTQPKARAEALKAFSGDIGTDQQLGWDGRGRQTATVALPSGIEVVDPHRAVVTVAVLARPGAASAADQEMAAAGRWVYLAVPVVVDGGAFAVAGQPSLVPAPATTNFRPIQAGGEDDAALASELRPNLAAFLKAYAASDRTQLGYYAAPGATFAGLGGLVDLGELVDLQVDQSAGTTRGAAAQVRWVDKITSASLTQTYRLVLDQGSGKWLVRTIQPGGAWTQ